jgi:hypothetical protein
VWLIGRDDNFIGQILEVFKDKKKNKRKRRGMFSKMNCG